MNFNLSTPCSDCPFRRSDGAVRLMRGRVLEITNMLLSSQGGTFACHKTTVASEDDSERVAPPSASHCAGALIFAEKNDNATQMMRIMERLGMYDARALRGHDDVFDDQEEMLATAIDAKRARRRAR